MCYAHLRGGDAERGVGQLLVLRLIAGQACRVLHLLKLLRELRKEKRVKAILIESGYLCAVRPTFPAWDE